MCQKSFNEIARFERDGIQEITGEQRIMKKTTVAAIAALFTTILILSTMQEFLPRTLAATDSGWTLTSNGRGVKAYPDLREYVWQKNASMPPNGPYDKIGLHRLVKIGVPLKGVIFVCPGTYASSGDYTFESSRKYIYVGRKQ